MLRTRTAYIDKKGNPFNTPEEAIKSDLLDGCAKLWRKRLSEHQHLTSSMHAYDMLDYIFENRRDVVEMLQELDK